jgi:CO/xanthine dehydrogenase FAD-binding subunit
VLIALEAQVVVVGPGGEKSFPLKRLYTGNGKKPLALKTGEILKEIHIPPPQGKTLYLKSRLRDSIEYPILSLALTLHLDDTGKIKKARAVLSGVGPGPVSALKVQRCLTGNSPNAELIDQASSLIPKEISPMRTSTVPPAYRRKMSGILLRKGLLEITRP